MITTEMKDKLLEIIVESYKVEQQYSLIPIQDMIERGANFSNSEIDGIFSQFQRDGLISKYFGLARHNTITSFIVHEPAHQKWQRGGYQLEELIVLQQLDKLNEEVKQLKSKLKLEDLNNLTSIVTNITSAFKLFFRDTNIG